MRPPISLLCLATEDVTEIPNLAYLNHDAAGMPSTPVGIIIAVAASTIEARRSTRVQLDQDITHGAAFFLKARA